MKVRFLPVAREELDGAASSLTTADLCITTKPRLTKRYWPFSDDRAWLLPGCCLTIDSSDRGVASLLSQPGSGYTEVDDAD
jgi:hypothetical protein